MAQHITVVPYQEEWEQKFAEEAAAIRKILGENCIAIHHIGSTSVKGLAAKPIIDIMPVVKDLALADSKQTDFAALGYEYLGEFGIPGRRYLRKGGEERTHQIHMFQEEDTANIDRHLAVCAYLRIHRKEKNAYGALKQKLAQQYPYDIAGYCAGKDAFVKDLEQKALQEQQNCREMIRTLRECIGMKSVKDTPKPGMPHGAGIGKALEFLLDTGDRMGFRTKNIEGEVGYIEYGEGDEMIAVLGHLDVVPAGDGWETPPFVGCLKDGKIYGRGALDDKGAVVASLYAMKTIRDAGIPLKRRIRLILGTDEESGSSDIKRYKQTEEIPVYAFTPDADFPVIHSEKGMAVFQIEKRWRAETEDSTETERGFTPVWNLSAASGGMVTNQVPDAAMIKLYRSTLAGTVDTPAGEHSEKDAAEVIRGIGRSAHGSTPEKGENAIDSLFENLKAHPCFESCQKELKAFVHFYLAYFAGDTKGEKLGAACKDPELGDATFNVGILEGSCEGIAIKVDYRHPANTDAAPYLEQIEKICREQGMRFSICSRKKGLYFPQDHPLVAALEQVYEEQTGEKAEPISIGGGTYAKSLPNTVAFGPIFPGHPDTMHQPNEWISIEDLMLAGQIYKEAMIRLANL